MGTDDSERTGRPRRAAVDGADGPSGDGGDDGADGSSGDRRDDGESIGSGWSAAPMSRRSFVLASGSVLGATGVGFGRTGARDATTVTVTASEPYRPAVAEMARDGGRSGDGPDVAVRSPGDDPFAAVSDGDVDVHVSGRPRIASADGAVRSTATETIVAGRGALVHDSSEWREVIDASELSGRASNGEPLETWSETDWSSFDAVERASGPAGAARTVVRGTRSFQYGRGRGGVGYYPVDRGALRTDGAAVRSDESTPLVRLGYVHADPSADLARDSVFRQLTDRDGRESPGGLSYFPGPGLRDRA